MRTNTGQILYIPKIGQRADFKHPLMRGCVGWWPLTDGAGGILKDISSNRLDATLNGTNTWETETLGTANRFDNSVSRTSHAETANTQPDLTGGYAFSTWVKHEEAGINATNRYGAGIILGNSSGSSDVEIYFNTNSSNNGQWPQVVHNRSNGGTIEDNNHSASGFSKSDDNGVWVHYAVTSDGSVTKVYRNGEQYGGQKAITNNPLSTAGYKLFINELPVLASNGGLTCSMQNVRLWSRVLLDSEVFELYINPWSGLSIPSSTRYFFVPTQIQQIFPPRMKLKTSINVGKGGRIVI